MRTPNRSTAFFAAAITAAVATFAVLSVTAGSDDPPTRRGVATATDIDPTASPEPTDEPPRRFATEDALNRGGDYAFAYPPGWAISARGTVSTVRSPDDRVVISFGFGRNGDLAAAIEELTSMVRASYAVEQLGAPRSIDIGGDPARLVSGLVRNDLDATLRVQFYVVAIDGVNYAISVFIRDDAPVRVERVVNDVVDSLESIVQG